MKMMPWFSTSSTAFSLTAWRSIRASVSCSSRTLAGLLDGDLALLILLGHDLLEHVLEIDVHLLHADVGEDLHRHGLLLDVQLDHAGLPVRRLRGVPSIFSRVRCVALVLLGVVRVPGRCEPGSEQIEQPLGDALLGLASSTSRALLWLDHADGDSVRSRIMLSTSRPW